MYFNCRPGAGNGSMSSAMGLGASVSRISPNGFYLRNFNPTFGRGRLKPYQWPPQPSKDKVLKEAGRLAAGYLSLHFPTLQGRARKAICRAELSQDAPFIAAIGACMLTSLVLPVPASSDDDDDDDNKSAALDSSDARFAAMGIISFIPYFNWLSWVFAWLDTGSWRYAVYSLAYLAPYLRTNLSLSPEESWLPIASILFCILHIQLEAGIRNGDLQGFQLFSEARKSSSMTTKKHIKSSNNSKNLPSSKEKTQRWGKAKERGKDLERLENDWEDREGGKH